MAINHLKFIEKHRDHVPGIMAASMRRVKPGTQVMLEIGESNTAGFRMHADHIPAIVWHEVRRDEYRAWARKNGLNPNGGLFFYRVATD